MKTTRKTSPAKDLKFVTLAFNQDELKELALHARKYKMKVSGFIHHMIESYIAACAKEGVV